MASLAVFDFDRTIVNEDSDATIITRLREKQPPPEWEAENNDWTPYMNEIFEHAHAAGIGEEEILSSIGAMRPTPGMVELITALAAAGWDILILTDANSIFVNHWLKVHGLQECVTSVVTNPARWEAGRLVVAPHSAGRRACARCPPNLCKARALALWARQPYRRVLYTGDGGNDYCPATTLPQHAIVFPRRGYPLDERIKRTLASPDPEVVAQVVPWDDGYRILHELFPEKSEIIA